MKDIVEKHLTLFKYTVLIASVSYWAYAVYDDFVLIQKYWRSSWMMYLEIWFLYYVVFFIILSMSFWLLIFVWKGVESWFQN